MMRLIDDCRRWWRLWSMRINAFGLLVLSYIQFDPVGALSVWNMLPGPAARMIPAWLVAAIGMTLFALSMLARITHQPKLVRPDA